MLGKDSEHEVYEGECIGMVMGLHLVAQEQLIRKLSIWADNSVAVTATDTSKTGSSHYLLNFFHNGLARLHKQHQNIHITISWIPSHKRLQGNEQDSMSGRYGQVCCI